MIDTVRIAPASIDDLETLISIERASFAQPWQRQAIIDEMACPDGCQWVAKTHLPSGNHADTVAYIFIRILIDEMHIMKIAVDPVWRRRGVAASLLQTAQTEARRRGATRAVLEVRTSNFAAVSFYEKTGYQTVAVRPNYYPKTGENALVMSKSLKEES